MKIENLLNCSGCHSCFSSCTQKAITMISDNEGFLFPQIEKSLCVNCGKCEIVCPVINKEFKIDNNEKTPLVYAVKNDNEKIREVSSSGGFFTAIAEKVIENGGVVFGAKFDEDQNVFHSYTENIEGLADFRGSKYVQSDIGNSFIEVKRFLENNRIVLFSGTPCQIGGLKSYLGKDYDNLFCLDFICHGVPSPILWRKYLDFQEKKFNGKIISCSFRDKSSGWKLYSMKLVFDNGKQYTSSLLNDFYLRIFLKNVALRKSCYNCFFRGNKRKAEITIADFWGCNNNYPEMDDDKGISLVFLNSDKGKRLFDSENLLVDAKIIPFEIAIEKNPSFYKDKEIPVSRNSFYDFLLHHSFADTARKFVKETLFYRIKRKAKVVIKRGVKK